MKKLRVRFRWAAFSWTVEVLAHNLPSSMNWKVLALIGLLLPPAVKAEAILFQNAKIFPVSSAAIEKGALLIENGKIKEVGQDISAEGAKIVDCSGKHIYPGMIAAGTTMGLVEIDAARATVDMREVGDYTPDVRSWLAVNPDSELLPVARANGITHFVPVPTGGIVAGQSGLVALQGWTVEDLAVKAPVALHLFWPSMSLDTTPREGLVDKSKFKSLEDQAKERAERLKDVDDFFSEAESYAKVRPEEEKGRIPAWEAMLPFLNGEIPLMVHADESRQIKAAVEWVVQRKYKMILVGARDAWMHADFLATNNIPVLFERVYYQTSSLAATPSRDVDPYDVHFKAPGVLNSSGVQVALGLGLGGHSASEVRNLPYIAAQAVAFGLPADVALKSITLQPAQMLGVADRLGSLEAGKEATFVVASGNILDIRTQVHEVWIAGQKTSLETRHTRLYEKYKNRPRPNSATAATTPAAK
jgi:imidazolonepropionase-like amidohydrolase